MIPLFIYDHIGKLCFTYRQSLHLDQYDAAKAAGIHEEDYRKAEWGNYPMSLETFVKLRDWLGVSADFMIDQKVEEP